VTRAQQQLDTLAQFLQKHGDDPARLDMVKRAQTFKRSWIELAEALVRVRSSGEYRAWGYDDFHRYCQGELQLKAATVDKLTVSYATLQHHAPDVLQRDGVVRAIPSVQAIDYFARAVDRAANDAVSRGEVRFGGGGALDDLRSAVFEDAQPVTQIRKHFDPILRPQSEASQQLGHIDMALRLARKLIDAMPLIDGLSMQRRQRTEASLDLLREDLDRLRAPLADSPEDERAAS
jgi:hypothetical protein